MKHINLIEWLQTDSHGKQSATRDHHGTKSRELPDNPRLYSYPCATLALPLRYVAMIFAVLVMSIGNVWGATTYPSTGSHSRAFYSITSISAAQTMSTSKSTNPGYAEITSGATITGGKAYVGVNYTSSSTKGLVLQNTNCWKIDQNYIWCVINSTDPFVAGDTIYISNGGQNAYALSLNRATDATANYTSNSSTYTASTTTPVKGTEYYFVLPANFETSNYLVINKSASGNADFSYLYACHAGGGGCTNVGISTQPTSPVAATVGSACSITGLVASGTSPSYQWYTCNSDGSSATAINAVGSLSFTGYQTATLGLTPTAAGTTYYKCVVSGSCGDPVTSNVVAVNATAQYTVTYNLNGGKYNGSSDAPTQSAVTSGTSITMPVLAPTKSGYAFTGWRSSVNSNDYMPSASYTMTAANTTFTAQWTEACFEVPDARKNSNPAATITASMLQGNKIAGGTLTWESANDYSGNADHGLILNEDGEQIVVTLSEGTFVAGSIITITTHGNSGTSKTCGVKVSGNNMTPATYSTESTGYRPFSQTYVVQAGDGIVGTNTFAIKRYNSNQVYIYSITVSGCGAPSCTAPNHVDVSGRWDRFAGETISLTATAYSSAGTGSPIAAGSITGYQWEKLVGTTWTALSNGTTDGVTTSGATTANLQIANCKATNSGKYRCVVSTGTTCSTASATKTDGTEGFGVKVYVLECYTGGTTEHHFTRTGDSQAGTLTMNLTANTAYTFKVHADNTYYGNNGTINKDETNWVMCNSDNGDDCAKNLTVNSGLGGTFTFGIEYSTSGSSSVEGEPEISVTYPRKTMYLVPNSDWTSNSAKFAFYYYGTSGTGWTDFLTSNDCGMSAEIPQWNGLNVIAVRFNPSDATPGWNGDGHVWNQTGDIAATADKNCVTITDWSAGTYGTYSTPTYTISYNKGTNGTGSKANESKTCGVDFTLPGSTFTYAGHTQDGWAIADGGAIAYALSGSYTTNDDEEFFPHWKCNTPTITDNGNNTVTITVPAGTTVRYTTDGSTPTSSTGTVYSSAFTIDATVTVKAIAYQSGCTDSEIASQACTYHAPVGDEHVYYYKDATHYVSSSYKNPEGNTPGGSDKDNVALTTPWTIRNNTFMTGLTSVVATAATYDNKGNHMNAYIKLRQTDGGKIVFTIASGYTATIKIKMGGYSGANTNITMKLNDSGDNITYSGTMSGAATTEDNYAQLTYADLAAGAYTLKPTSGSLYISQIDIETEAVAACTAAPTVTAGSNSSVGSTTATVSCASGITSLGTGGCTITSYGFVLGTSANPTLSNTVHEVGTTYTTTGTSFSKNLTGLTASTTYYVRPYATNGYGTGYGTQTSFTTSAAAALNDGCWDPANTAADKLTSGDVSLTTFDNNFSGVTGITSVTLSKGTGDGKCSGADETPTSSGYLKVKNASSSGVKIITIVTSAAKDITIGGEPYGSNTGSFYLVKSTAESTKLAECNTGATSKATNCPAGTYYVYAKGNSSKSINFSLLCIEDAAPDETAPTFVSSVPANGATGVATSGTIVLTFSEALGTVDASKFTLTGATKGAVAIDGSDATKVNIAYSGAEEEATVTLATAAAAVSDLAGNALAAALSDISFTTAAAAPAGDCITIAYFDASQGSSSSNKPDNAGKYLYGYTNSAKTEAYAYTITTSSTNNKGQGTGASDYLRVDYGSTINIYADNTTTGGTPANFSNVTSVSVDFKMNKSSYYTTFDIFVGSTKIANNVSLEGAAQSAFTTFTYNNLEQLNGKISIVNKGSGTTNFNFHIDNIQICTSSLPACTTPVLPTLTAKTVCEGGDADAAWNATITNSGSLVSGETVAYSWVKKGSSTVLSSVATYQPTDVTEAMAGTYVVTATVSADGKASKSASKEVELAVNATVEISSVTQSPATVYAGNSVTLTATANVSATWQWYTCTNAEGDGESSIGSATSAAYAFTAPASAGTYYYKVKATGPCGGVATEVYALTISAATGGDCDTYYFFANAADATTNSVTQNEESFFSGASEGTNNNSTSITVDENSLSISKRTSAGAYSVVFTVPTGATATLYTNAKANNTSYPLIITRSSDSEVMEITNSTTLANYTLADIPDGTWTLSSGSGKNWYYGAIIVKVCTGATCTDPAVTASVSKSNVCAGSGEGVTFTASDAHASATYKWQKQNGSTWDDISGATAATYTIATVEASHAGKYRVVASHECDRISNELTLTVATTPVFGDLGSAREVETGGSLSITDVEATNTTGYKWYKSANATYDSGSDEQVGTSKNLMLPVNETAGSTFYLFCVASNACTSTVSGAITVNVIAPVEKDCAVGTSNGENFTTAKTSSVSSGTYNSQTELHMNNNNKYIYYVAATGYHFETATVNCCAGDATALTKAAYGYSTDGGATWTDADLPGAMTNQYSNHVVNLPADVNAFRVGRVLGDHGVGSNTLYVHEVCFTYVADCNATTIAISNATPSYDLSVGGDFTEPTCTVKQGGTTLSPQPTLRYSSFNEDIATVDPSTGDVDFTGTAGSVMIMASYDGDETYCESSATYTITVSCGSESAPKIVAGSGTNLSGCNAEVNLVVKDQNGNDFASGSYQWYRDGEEIDGATSATYTANRTGTYTVSHTGVCTQMSTNSAVVTSESFDPSVERLVPFQYYHANKTYTDQMKMRHLFAVTSGGDYEGKRYYMTATRNGAPLDITTSTAFSVRTSKDNRVDSVMIDLNRLDGKFNAGDEIVLTCAAIADCGTISAVTENIEIHVIDNTPTLALICSGTNKSAGTRKTSELTVGGDFLTGYNKADLCEQTGSTSFNANTEWGLYTELKEHYIVTPVNGYAVFNKLNYEPFDILLLTDYPKASKSTEAALILDDMYELCDYRPMLSFKTHMVQPADKLDGRESHWKKKGFTTQPEVPKQSRLRLNIVCYAHPMFEEITEGVANDYDDESQIVYTMLSGPGHESEKGMQGFHLAAAENFVTIGLVHYNATATDNYGGSGNVKWTPGSGDEMLVAAAERQTNLEARFILFSLNCGAQSKLTAQGNTVVLKCLEYLLNDATIEGNVADCELTFDNKAGDHKWSNKANWAPKYSAIPGEYNSTRIAAPATVDLPHAKVMSVRIKEGGSIYIPAGSALDVKSTVRHKDVGSDVRPTDVDEIHIGSSASGNGTLIFNNNTGDTKARVDMYSTAKADVENMSAATSTWQYIGTPHTDVANARSNYYGSWLYQYVGGTWTVIPNGGPLVAFRGYCITNETAPIVYDMAGTLVATTTQDIAIPAGYTVIANSWVAPIDITTFTDDDMENISDKTIYFFNTGTDAEGTAGTGTAPGTYVAVPKNSASYVETWQIPSMQGFYISTTSAGTLHLDYDRHVRPTGSRSVVSNPMYAPRRAAAKSDEPNVLKIFARGSRYQDKLVVLEREDFTRGYDSGWDGEAWGGSDLSPMVYVTGEGREDAVSAIPEFEGTVVAFKAGEDSEYRFEFVYSEDAEPLYLFDTENNTYTQIMTGNAYYFTTSDKSPHSRFILTRKNPQVATGVEPTSDSSLKGRAKKLLIEDKMFIMVNGMLYDATGKVVK